MKIDMTRIAALRQQLATCMNAQRKRIIANELHYALYGRRVQRLTAENRSPPQP